MAARYYDAKIRLAIGLAFGGAVASGLIAGRIARASAPGEHFWIIFPALLLAAVLAFVASIPWWRRLDDMHRTGHLISWYWGGIGGMAIALMALIAGTGVHSAPTTGELCVVFGEAAAFVLFWLGWKVAHRGPKA